MKKFAVLVLCLGFLMACVSMKPVVTGYVVGSATLRQIHDTGVMMEQSGALTADQVIKIKALYNDVRKLWLAAGDVLVVALETNDAVLKKEMMAKYNDLLTQYNALANELILLAYDFGILKQMAIDAKK